MTDRQTFDDPDLQHIYQKMLAWLADGEVSEKRLVDRIVRLKKLYPDTIRYVFYTKENAQKVVEKLCQQGLVDDRKYAARLFELLKDKKDGMRVIRRKMMSRKLPMHIVDDVLKEFEENGGKQDLEKITSAAKIKYQRLHEKYGADPKKKYQINSKVYAWLALKGFNPDESRHILDKIR